MKAIGISLLVAIAAAVFGLMFTEIFALIFTGLTADTSRIVGIGVYLCIVMVMCTGVIISEIKKK